jgi:hypothetical protein
VTARLTEAERDEILALARDGTPRATIAERVGRNPSTITAVCRAAGVTFRKPTSTPTPVDPGAVDGSRAREGEILRAQVVDLYRQGLTYEVIGRRMGFSKQRAHALYWDAMHAVLVQSVDAHRAEMIDELTEAVRVAMRVLHTDHHAVSNGRVVCTDDGVPVIDDAPKLDAARTIIAAHARLSKLIGADAPTELRSSETVTHYVVTLGDDAAAREALT